MPRDSIRTLVMSAEKDAVKRFLSHMHQSWNQLQVETSQVCFKTPNKTRTALNSMCRVEIGHTQSFNATCKIYYGICEQVTWAWDVATAYLLVQCFLLLLCLHPRYTTQQWRHLFLGHFGSQNMVKAASFFLVSVVKKNPTSASSLTKI